MPGTIGTCLWFENQAEEAAEFYTSVFDDSKILNVSRFGEGGPGPAGQAIAVEFELEGRGFTALNGARGSSFTEAVSFVINCGDQDQVDRALETIEITSHNARSMIKKDDGGPVEGTLVD